MALISPAEAVVRLRAGEVVALPTETVYGLAGRIDDETALHKIFATKQRPFFDPLIVHVTSVAEARRLSADWTPVHEHLAQKFWPGPLTLVTTKTPAVSALITSGLTTVALRCPAHPVMLEVLRELGVALAAPSANRFGRTSPTTAAHVDREFAGQVPVVDGGPCAVGLESTVVEITADEHGAWDIKVLRPGGVGRAQLRESLVQLGERFNLTRESSVASPGHLKAHYQPVSPVILLEDQAWSPAIQARVELQLGRVLNGVRPLALPATPQTAARELYELFRQHSTDVDHALWIRRTPLQKSEEWEAIWDRVERAACIYIDN